MDMNRKIIDTLMAVNDISQRPRLSFEEKLQGILMEIVDCMNVKKGSIMIAKGRKTLEVAASTNPDIIGCRQSVDKNSPSSWVFKNKKPLYMTPETQQTQFHKKFDHYQKDAFFLAPILSQKRVLGILSVTEKRGQDAFSEREQEVLLSIAGHIIGDLENHRLAESLKKNRKELQAKNRKLKFLEKIRSDLFHMLIHDLKAPISEVVANIDILSYTIDEENREYVEAAQLGCDTLYRMISDLLDIARMEEGSLPLVPENIDAAELVNEAVARLHGIAQAKHIDFKNTSTSDQKLPLTADRSIVGRVLQNLLVNALHYSPERGFIEVGAAAAADGRAIEFHVADAGPGIPPEAQETVFDKYAKVYDKNTERMGSVGLGLAFCKMAVEAHKGRIWVESDGQKGSRFVFTLPVRQKGGV